MLFLNTGNAHFLGVSVDGCYIHTTSCVQEDNVLHYYAHPTSIGKDYIKHLVIGV